jgi:putative addiction module component (TIGR02574 family)
MSTALAGVLKAALNLSADEKKDLIDSLWESMPETAPEFDPEVLAEIDRRSDELEAGKAELLTWQEVQTLLDRDRRAHE